MGNQVASSCCCKDKPPSELRACCFENLTCDTLTVEECEALGGVPQGVGSVCINEGLIHCDVNGECSEPWAEAGCPTSVAFQFYGVEIEWSQTGFICTSSGGIAVWDVLACTELCDNVCALTFNAPGNTTVIGETNCGELGIRHVVPNNNVAYACGPSDGCIRYFIIATLACICPNNPDTPTIFSKTFQWETISASGCVPTGDFGVVQNGVSQCGLRIL